MSRLSLLPVSVWVLLAAACGAWIDVDGARLEGSEVAVVVIDEEIWIKGGEAPPVVSLTDAGPIDRAG